MLDHNLIGKTYPEILFSVEKQRLKFFAKATQQTDLIYFDEDFAKTKGHRSILAPLTFLTTVGYEQEYPCLLYTSPSPRDQRGSRMPSSA